MWTASCPAALKLSASTGDKLLSIRNFTPYAAAVALAHEPPLRPDSAGAPNRRANACRAVALTTVLAADPSASAGSAPSATRTRDLLLRRQSQAVARCRLTWPDVASSAIMAAWRGRVRPGVGSQFGSPHIAGNG